MIGNFFRSFRNNLVTGALVLIPFAAVLWILLGLWNWIYSLSGWFPTSLHPRSWLLSSQEPSTILSILANFGVTLFVLSILIFMVCMTGVISRNFLGKKLVFSLEHFLARLPVLNTVYSSLRQLIDTFGSAKEKNFRRVVLIEYPRSGVYTLAFVTGEREENPISGNKERILTVYVPTTPNPTSGFYLMIPYSSVKDCSLSVEEALKEVISMGIIHRQTSK